MQLYLLRHAEAVPLEGNDFAHDSERILTQEGVKRIKEVAKAMRLSKLSFDLILSSPFIRARQTAEPVAIELKAMNNLQFSRHLACGGNACALVEEILQNHASASKLLLVGHEPFLSRLMSMLLTGGPDLPIHFRKAALAELSIDTLIYGRCAVLEGFITSKQLAKMAG